MNKSPGKPSRRTFLLAATAGAAVTATAIVAGKATDEATAKDGSTPSSQGYQLTAHVQNYYRTAKI